MSPEKDKGRKAIAHIEHYCNERDMVSRWGALYNIGSILDNRYSGTVFVRMGASGHMFNQHYLVPLFARAHNPGVNGAPEPNGFLDKTVDIDERLALRREDTAMHKMGLMRRASLSPLFEFGDGEGTCFRSLSSISEHLLGALRHDAKAISRKICLRSQTLTREWKC